jgi:hypothetical protein
MLIKWCSLQKVLVNLHQIGFIRLAHGLTIATNNGKGYTLTGVPVNGLGYWLTLYCTLGYKNLPGANTILF